MRHFITTVNDLRNWVDGATTNWDGRTGADVDAIANAIRSRDDCPAWGTDWTEYLADLPELSTLLPATVTVWYWRGTMHLNEKARSYTEAMEIASRNSNAYGPKFYDENGVELYDDGNGLHYEDEPTGPTTATRRYAM